MSWDRRCHARSPRLIRATFDSGPRVRKGLATDISESGAFVSTTSKPGVGAEITLTVHPPTGGQPVELRSVVVRVASAAPTGFAVRWTTASTRGAEAHLRAFLLDHLGVQARVTLAADGRALWTGEAVDAAEPEAAAAPAPAPTPAPEPPPVLEPHPSATYRAPERRPPPDERRRRPRVLSAGSVLFQLDGESTVAGTIRDINMSGMWVDTSEVPPRVGELVSCRYPLPDEITARLVGKVVRAEAGASTGFAVQLIRVDDRERPGAFERHLRERSTRD